MPNPSVAMRHALYAIVLSNYCVTAVAAVAIVSSAPPDLLTLPWAAIGISMLLSVWGGLIATLSKLNTLAPDDTPAGRQVRSIYVELIKDLLASTGAGFISFAVGMSHNVDIYGLCVLLFAAGYAGTRVIDAAGDAVIAVLRAVAIRRGGE